MRGEESIPVKTSARTPGAADGIEVAEGIATLTRDGLAVRSLQEMHQVVQTA